MIKCIIVDDDFMHSESLISHLSKIIEPIIVSAVCRNIESAINAIEQYSPDLVFLDIELEKGELGFDLLKMVKEINFEAIFVSSFVHNYTNQINMCGLTYIRKPYIFDEIEKSVNIITASRKLNNIGRKQLETLVSNTQLVNKEEQYIWIKKDLRSDKIQIKDILYCEAENTSTKFVLINKIGANEKKSVHENKISSKLLKDWAEILEIYSIIRTHRSFLVNTMYIKGFEHNGTLILPDGITVSVSDTYMNKVKQRIGWDAH